MFWFGIFYVAALVLYLDATRNKIGRVEGQKGLLNISAGEWAFCGLAIAVITWPLYLINRKKLLLRAKEHPVTLGVGHRVFVSALLIVLPALIFLGPSTVTDVLQGRVTIWDFAPFQTDPTGLPLCDSALAQKDVDNAIANAPLGRVAGISVIRYQHISTQSSTLTEVRCTADATLNNSVTTPITYSFSNEEDQLMVRFQFGRL